MINNEDWKLKTDYVLAQIRFKEWLRKWELIKEWLRRYELGWNPPSCNQESDTLTTELSDYYIIN